MIWSSKNTLLMYFHFWFSLWLQQMIISRRSRPEVFCKKGVLKNFTKFTEKHLCQSLFFNKAAGLPAFLLKKRLKFVNFLRTPISIEHLRWLLLIFFVLMTKNVWVSMTKAFIVIHPLKLAVLFQLDLRKILIWYIFTAVIIIVSSRNGNSFVLLPKLAILHRVFPTENLTNFILLKFKAAIEKMRGNVKSEEK